MSRRSARRRLARLEDGLAEHYAFERILTNLKLPAFAWRARISVPGYGREYVLRIELDERRAVEVIAEDWHGPMRHTYGANRLCMWYPRDPPNRQWHEADGLLRLVDMAMAHLFKELYFQETGDWLGEEVHQDAPKAEQHALNDRAA